VIAAGLTCLGRVAEAPAVARERPSDLDLGALVGVSAGARRPGARVPDEEPGATDHETVFPPHDGQETESVCSVALPNGSNMGCDRGA